MKIAMLGHKYFPSREGGVERVVEELSTRMAALGHEVTVYNRTNKYGNNKKIKEYNGVKVKHTFTINKKGYAAATSSFFGTLKVLFSRNKIVHYHAEGPCFWLKIIKIFSRKKVIVTIHGLDWQRAKWDSKASAFIKIGEKRAAKYADKIIVLSKNMQKYFKDTYNRDTIYIPNGVDKPIKKKADIINKKYGLKKDSYILYLGRLVPEKGIHYLIEAYNQLNTDKKLVIAGRESDTESYRDLLYSLSKRSRKNIIFTGFVQGDTLRELYSNAYVYCLPSDLEGMPLSLLEAMSYGNCCVTSNIKELTEIIDNNKLTFNKSDTEDLRQVLQKCCDNEKMVKQYQNESQEYILSKYNWDDVVKKTIDTYLKA